MDVVAKRVDIKAKRMEAEAKARAKDTRIMLADLMNMDNKQRTWIPKKRSAIRTPRMIALTVSSS
jgi:hypothetical protein